MKILIISSPYLVSGTVLHSNFNTYLIYSNQGVPILHSEMSMASSKLKMMLPVKFLEKRMMSDYLMTIAKDFESVFELSNANVKLKVLNNKHN